MPKCKCGCGEKTEGGDFVPGHDQRLRIRLENQVGGLFALRRLVTKATDYASGEMTAEEFTAAVRKIFSRRGNGNQPRNDPDDTGEASD